MMKNIFTTILVLLLSAAIFAQESNNIRVTKLFNFHWKFQTGDLPDAINPDFNDAGWRNLDIPHDFQFEQPWDKTASRGRGFKAMGVGWYRKTFKADANWKGKQILLDFEGIMLHGEVWLNGKKIGGTDYGYLGFEADISDVIKYDADNVVAVRATTGEAANSRWYTGGGLFRDVHLVVKDKISVARHGVYITTPNISGQNAEVSVQVEVGGIKNQQLELEINTKIFSPNGQQVAETKTFAPKKWKLSEVEVPLPKVNVANPQLWSCESPNLYSAEVTLILDGKVIDKVTEMFGIRTIEFSKEFGLKLNGKKVFLKGVANHHDQGAVGAADYRTSIARMMDKLKAFGFNHIRTSHNPYSETFLKLADEKGLLIVDELYDKWSGAAWSGNKPWNELWFKNEKEWLKRDRNHPSVIMWSFGNELQMQEERWGIPTGDWGITTYNLMNVVAKRYDPTRKTTVAMYPARATGILKADPDFKIKENIIPPELATKTEVASFNYVWDDYQEYLKHAPDMIIYQSEAVTNELGAPYFGMDRDKMVGLAYWGAIEYWGESLAYPIKGWNYSFFTHSLEPNPQAYLIKSIFKENEPLIHIGIVDSEAESQLWNDVVVGRKYISSHWNREAGKNYDIYTYTNAAEVELLVNGQSIGVQKNNTETNKRNVIFWKGVPYLAGKIVAIAKDVSGKEIARHVLETTGEAVALKIVTENADWKADGMDLQYIKIYAVDKEGRTVPTFKGEATFDISGEAKLIAVDNGDHSSEELFSGNKRTMFKGFAMAIARSKQTAGNVTIKASAVGLKSAENKIKTQ